VQPPLPNNMTKYGLAIHTSSPALGLAISNGVENVRSQSWDLGRETSDYLHIHLAEFIKPQTWQNLGWIAVANGPGGFTGTRLGLVTARTLGQQLDLPVLTISSLAAIAWTQPQVGIVAISMPAQRGEVFGAIYHLNAERSELTTICTDAIYSAINWSAKVAELQDYHHHVVLQSANLADTVVGVLALAKIAHDQGQQSDWSMALPFYGQHPIINSSKPAQS
jgi:tRNA threonylcarbamoyl adenosine modification protein YeaZ